MPTVALKSHVVVAVWLRGIGSARAVVRACLTGTYSAVLGPALMAEYEDVLGRDELFADSVLTASERSELFEGFLSQCRWVEVYYPKPAEPEPNK